MALSLGAQGICYLEGQNWDVSLSYRYLHSDRIFSGSHDLPELRNSSVSDIHSVDLTTTYAFTKRFSVSFPKPRVSRVGRAARLPQARGSTL